MVNLLKKYLSAKALVVGVVWVIAIALIGMFDLFNMSFDSDRLKDESYWTEVITLLIAGILIFAMTLYKKYTEHKEEDVKSQDMEDKLTESLSTVGTGELAEFTNEKNIERRKTAYKDKMSKEYQNLISKITLKHPKSLDIWVGDDDARKATDPWCVKLARIESITTDEYLEHNKFNLPVSFTKITPNFIQSGVNKDNGMSSLENPSKGLTTALHDNVINFIIPIITTSILIGMVLTTSEQTRLMFIFMLLVKMFALLIQHISATIYEPSFYSKTRVSDLGLRYRLSEDYLTWKKRKKNGKEARSDAQKR